MSKPSKLSPERRLLQARGCLLWTLALFAIIYSFSGRGDAGKEASKTEKVVEEAKTAPREEKIDLIEDLYYGDQQVPPKYPSLDFNDAESTEAYCESLDSMTYNVTPKGSNQEALMAVRELLERYVKEHNASSALFPYDNTNKNVDQDRRLCHSRRSFVVGTYACPQQLGTRVHEMLNAFAGAVILNRTLLWHYCDRESCRHTTKQLDRCDEMLETKPWIASAEEITQRLGRGGCSKANGYAPRNLNIRGRNLAVANKNNLNNNG